jgi:hypothetical protein
MMFFNSYGNIIHNSSMLPKSGIELCMEQPNLQH